MIASVPAAEFETRKDGSFLLSLTRSGGAAYGVAEVVSQARPRRQPQALVRRPYKDVGSGSPGPLSAKARDEPGHPRQVLAVRGHSLEQVHFFQPRLEEGPQYAEAAG